MHFRFVMLRILLILLLVPAVDYAQPPPAQTKALFILFNRTDNRYKDYHHLFSIIESHINNTVSQTAAPVPGDSWARLPVDRKKQRLSRQQITHLVVGELGRIDDKVKIELKIKDQSLAKRHYFEARFFSADPGELNSCKDWALKTADNIKSYIETGVIKEELKITKFECENASTTPRAITRFRTKLPRELHKILREDNVIKAKYIFTVTEEVQEMSEENVISGIINPRSSDTVKVQIYVELKSDLEVPDIESRKMHRNDLTTAIQEFARHIITHLKRE